MESFDADKKGGRFCGFSEPGSFKTLALVRPPPHRRSEAPTWWRQPSGCDSSEQQKALTGNPFYTVRWMASWPHKQHRHTHADLSPISQAGVSELLQLFFFLWFLQQKPTMNQERVLYLRSRPAPGDWGSTTCWPAVSARPTSPWATSWFS